MTAEQREISRQRAELGRVTMERVDAIGVRGRPAGSAGCWGKRGWLS